VTLGAKSIDFVWLNLLDDANEVGRIGKVSVVEYQAGIRFVGVLVKVVNSFGVEAAGSPFDAMNNIALFEQQFR
jgi:hypothetical protein